MITQTIKNSLSPLKGTIVNMTELDIRHKTDFETFVRAEPNGRFRAFMVELFDRWHQYNRDYFAGKLVIPTYILLGTPTKPSVLGQYATVSSFGGTSEIRIRPTLFTGKHPSINASAPMEGRNRFLFDVLLHEVVHQYQIEILGQSEDSFHGHGPVFRDECNRISAIMGITAQVRSCKKRGKDKDLSSCAHWPWCVRPSDYYMGAWIEKEDRQSPKPEPDPPETPQEPEKLSYEQILKLVNDNLDDTEKKTLSNAIIHPGYRIWLKNGHFLDSENIRLLAVGCFPPQQLLDVAEYLIQVRKLFDYERLWNAEQCDGYFDADHFLTAVIARDRSDILEKMKAGEFVSVKDAVIAAEILPKEKDFFFDIRDTESWFEAAWTSFTPEEMYVVAKHFSDEAYAALRLKIEGEHPDNNDKLDDEIFRLEDVDDLHQFLTTEKP